MKILAVHNFYQQPGGEDRVFAQETALLEEAGHKVVRFTETNDRVEQIGRLQLASATIWNSNAYRRVAEVVARERPDVVHFHNTFPLLSPACYYAARRGGAATIQTLHNFRLICPGPNLLRDGKPCEDCVGKLPWRSVWHACYRHSRSASAGVTAMLSLHRALRTYNRAVNAYIALTEFSRSRFIAGGLPAERLFCKPNFTAPDPGAGAGGPKMIYVGRLSEEKGIGVLLDAWREDPALPELHLIGDGPLAPTVEARIASLNHVRWLGQLAREQVIEHMHNAMAIVLPSICYENFPLTVVEAYSTGLPVIASRLGAMAELVRDGVTGLLFAPGDAADLRAKIRQFESMEQERFRIACRAEYDRLYTPAVNYKLLIAIYEKAIARAKSQNRNG